MAEQTNDLQKLMVVATDLTLSAKLRVKSVELIGSIPTYEALLALLKLAANERLTRNERELALKYAQKIVKKSRE